MRHGYTDVFLVIVRRKEQKRAQHVNKGMDGGSGEEWRRSGACVCGRMAWWDGGVHGNKTDFFGN